ncbi:AAA family ATPase [Cohnella mopanensis]|uniref:AAA family ATPase n=1 Tax=Cohnella mopanensis TaxID=2911966 RepID=UPI001EF7FFF3|nr:SMC family ATPase [Cohnella mopanensis]
MKPIRISMTAFGPYRDTETIDFSLLEDRRLFVISGNTGAGKTTIFDAICFALYGSASGEDRAETRMLRSHFASDDDYTSVDYHFAVGKRTYRVFRQMAHRRGTNKNETGGKAELYETTSGTEVPCIDRFTVSDVNAKMESVIGLTREQFSQIVMLPQGEFRKLLTSDTENKEEILRKIFRTGLYQKIEDRFQLQHRELQDSLKQAKAMQDIYAKQARETLPQREESLLTATLNQEVSSMGQVSEGLVQEIAYYDGRAADIELGKSAVNERLQAQEAALAEAVALEGRFAQLAEKRVQSEQLEARQAEIGESEKIVKLAEQAARIEPYEEQALAALRQLELKRSFHARKLQDAADAERGHAVAEEAFRGEETRDAERKEADRELARLAELKPIVQTLEERKVAIERLTAEERAVTAKRESIEQRLGALREEKRSKAEQLKLAETEVAKLPGMLQQYEQMKNKYKLLKELAELDRRIVELSKHEEEREKIVRGRRAEHDRLESLWLEGQAGLLATHLHDGKACPVCGSEEHPNKAIAVANVPSREGLQAAKDQLRQAEQELNEAQAQAAAANGGKIEKESLFAEYGITRDPFAEQLLRSESEGKLLRAETDRLKQQADLISSHREEGEKLDLQLDKLHADREQLLAEQHRLSVDRSAKQSVLDNELSRIPEDLRSPTQLLARINEHTDYVNKLNHAWQQAQRQLQSAKARLVEEKAIVVQAVGQLEESNRQHEQARIRFDEELAKSGFAAKEHYQSAKLVEADRLNLAHLIEQYNSARAALLHQINELERELAGRTRPLLSVLQEAITALKAQLEQLMSELHTVSGYRQEAKRLLTAIEKAVEQFRELELKQQRVSDIYQMLKGDNPLKISFERYILIEFLEQILDAANVRLNDLSNGQFKLERSDRLETRGKQSGLGLDVYDAYTGQNRDVKSMSGGEKFNASLCLALGMTDVIQAYQGGVSIEMMFIDEGFGSLDEDSLNKAIATLVDLQRSGRMIGVISHVEELKMAFPAVLEVSKTKEGHSRTAILLK